MTGLLHFFVLSIVVHLVFLFLNQLEKVFPSLILVPWSATDIFPFFGVYLNALERRLYIILSSLSESASIIIMNTLTAEGLDENTIVIFCSDNGAQEAGATMVFLGKQKLQFMKEAIGFPE